MQHHLLVFISALSLVTAAAGCASAAELRTSSTPRTEASEAVTHASSIPCVMEVPGTGLWTDEIDGGIALVFRTVTPESVDDLRSAVRSLGDRYEGQAPPTHVHVTHAEDSFGRGRDPQEMGLPSLSAQVVHLDDGGRLELRAADSAAVQSLRSRIGAQARAMSRGACPIFAR